MNIFALNPYVRLAMESILPDGCHIPTRALFDYELIYIERGNFLLTYAGTEYSVRMGDFLLLHPAVSHSFDCNAGEISQPHIHFDMVYSPHSEENPISYKDLPSMTVEEKSRIAEDFLPMTDSPFVTFKDRDEATALLKKIITAFRIDATLAAKANLTLLLSLLFENNYKNAFETNPSTKAETLCKGIKAFLDTGGAYSLTLPEIAAHFSYHPTYLEKLFKEKCGMGIIAYKNARRMQEAKRLLRAESVTAVAHRLGYSSVYAFSRAFKKHFGVSPQKVKARQNSVMSLTDKSR